MFIYALAFSYAYTSLDTGTGALILFGSVQITIVAWQYYRGKRLSLAECLGIFIAFSGLIYLVYPILSTPALRDTAMMFIAGSAWAAYTLRGKASRSPLTDTAYNFFRTLPMLVIIAIYSWPSMHLNAEGVIYACLSGALASGVGYALWYVALEHLSATLAAVMQLAVPIIAALGGVLIVIEPLSLRLVLATILVLIGISLVIYQNAKH